MMSSSIRQPAVIGVILAVLAAATLATAEPAQWKQNGWDKTDFSRSIVPWSEIQSGGPPKDGIPSIDKPQFVPVGAAAGLADTEPVIGLEIAGDARAYPLRILTWHEIVNDVVGGTPVAVTYCPLCNSSVVFERTIDGRTLDFGTTGKLRNSDLVMYDRQSESWWQQFTGEAIVGVMLGKELKRVPSRLESWANFRERHPRGKVLVPNDPSARRYGNNPYFEYDTQAGPFLYRGDLPDYIPAMARVVVVRGPAAPVAVALDLLAKRTPLRIGDLEFAWSKGQASALDAITIADGRDVGNVTVASIDPDGRRADVPYDVTFAFVVHAFHKSIRIRTE